MIKSFSFSKNQEVYSKSWDSKNIPKCLNKKNSFDFSNDNEGKIKNKKSKLYRNNTYHGTEKSFSQENSKKKEKLHKNFDFKNLLKKKNTSSSLEIASSAPISSPINLASKNKKNKNLLKRSKSKSIMKNISNNYGKKNVNNKNLSCSVDDIYKIKPKSEFKAKTRLLKSLVENIEDDTEDTCYDTEYSERSFIENLSVCKSTSNGIVSESLNSPSISEITITPAVVSIINSKHEINTLKQDLERYSKSPINENENKKSKFFVKRFFSRFKTFGWFDTQKRNNRKSSLSQSSTIDYLVTMDNITDTTSDEINSSNVNMKDQTDNEKSEITLVSSRNLNFNFTNLNHDSMSSREESNDSKSSNKETDLKVEKRFLNQSILSDKITNRLNDNLIDDSKNKEALISNTQMDKDNLFIQSNSDNSSLFSSTSLDDPMDSLSNIPMNENVDPKDNINSNDKIETFDKFQILSTSSPKSEVENKLKENKVFVTKNDNVLNDMSDEVSISKLSSSISSFKVLLLFSIFIVDMSLRTLSFLVTKTLFSLSLFSTSDFGLLVLKI